MTKNLLKRTTVVTALLGAFALCSVVLPSMVAAESWPPLSVAGSTTVQPIAQLSEAIYEATHPGIDISVSGGGSGVGQSQISNDAISVGMSSSNLSSSNFTGSISTSQVEDVIIGRDGISIVIPTSKGCASNITRQQIAGVYDGSINNWNQVSSSCGSEQIVPRARIIGSGTRASLLDMLKGSPYSLTDQEEQQVINNTGLSRLDSNSDVVSAISSSSNQICYVGLGYTDNPNIRVLNVENVAPTVANVSNGTYPLGRNLHMIYIKQSSDPTFHQEAVDYVNWMTSPEGQQLVVDAGYVNVQAASFAGDINLDHNVNIGDVVVVGNHWGETVSPAGSQRYDANKDGGVSIGDVVVIGNYWGQSW